MNRLANPTGVLLVAAGLLLGTAPAVTAQAALQPRTPTAPLYYHGYRYGSQALFSPFTVILNKGFDIFQIQQRNPRRVPWKQRAPVLRGVALHPAAAIERFPGWRTWLRTEVLPLSFGEEARWFPNYTEHFLGGGVTARGLTEWYESRGAPMPELLAGATTMAAAAINEMLEYDERGPVPSSSVADLWIFDLGGVLFFSWDGPARWMQNTLHVVSWPQMASITLPNGEIENNGDYYVAKVPLPFEGKELLLRLGLSGQVGLAQRLDAERTLSIALGVDTEDHAIDPRTGQEYVRMRLGGGAYLDRNNSLLLSVTASRAAQNRVAVNLYPGLVDRWPLKDFGLWLVFPDHGPARFGLASRHLLGAGLGFAH